MKITLTEVDFKTNKEIGTTELDMNITKEEMEEYSKLWCKCDYFKKHPMENAIYVEHYEGVSHGWICPHCKKFVQIG